MKKVIVAGSSGMIGQIILSHCLNDDRIVEVVSLVRQPMNLTHPKLNEIVLTDFLDYSSKRDVFTKVDAVYYCVGVYTGAVDRVSFRQITIDFPMALAHAVQKASPKSTFVLLSGQGADRKEKSRLMFALDKGIVENKLVAIWGNQFYACRPGYIYPVVKRKEPNFSYTLSRSLYPFLKLLGKKFSITSEELGQAMFHIGLNQPEKTLFENDDMLHYLEVVQYPFIGV